jgi:hypothetical protein
MELDLDQARRRAKELLRAARAGDPDALARMRDDRAPRLADAQRAVAADLGFRSWPALVVHVGASHGDREERRARLVSAALGGRDDLVEGLLAHDPDLAVAGLDVALVLGDERAVAAALDRDPDMVSRDLPGVGRKPLSCACHSVFLRPSSQRAPGVRRVIELLLERGATVRGTNALANAIGDPRKVRILLEKGDLRPADPELRDSLLYARDPAVAKLLIEHGAALDGDDEVVARLLDAGVPLDARGIDDGTALHYAGMWGRASTVELLLSRGAEVDVMGGPREHPGTPLGWTAWDAGLSRDAGVERQS